VNVNNRPEADLQIVSRGYFTAFGVQVVRGQTFTSDEGLTGEPVAMVSQSFAQRYLSGEDPLSQSVMIPKMLPGQPPGQPIPHRIVGVFADVANGTRVSDKDTPAIYLPFAQNPFPYIGMVVRTADDPGALEQQLRKTVAETDPAVTLGQTQTMREIVNLNLKGDRFSMSLFAAFAVLALLLAALGIYGVMAFAVSRRTHEIGVRMALGAEKRDVVALMVHGGMKLALTGAALGLAGAFVLGHVMRATLYGVETMDVASFLAVTVLLLGVALLASWLPARRSARIDPMVALREE
jgi:putative ABC transport system permease protein